MFSGRCVLSQAATGGIGTYLQVLGGDLLARSLPPDRPVFPDNYHDDHTLKDFLARGQRWRSSTVGARVSRLGALTLYLSVATGLVINFPTPLLASIGAVATVATIVCAFRLLRGIPGLDRRIRVFEGMQQLHSMRNGNVVAQIATVDYDRTIALSDSELVKVESLLERMLRDEQQIIDERAAQRAGQQAASPASTQATKVDPRPDTPEHGTEQ